MVLSMELGALGKRPAGASVNKYPLIKIAHRDNAFELPSGTFVDELEVVPLGLVRSRIMWPKEFGTSKGPLCHSDDTVIGIPGEQFPWSSFKGELARVATDHSPALTDCSTCNFTHWHKTRAKCNEEWVIPVVGTAATERGAVMLLKFSASALPMLTEWMTPYRDSGMPLYTEWVRITLDAVSRKGSQFSTPRIRATKLTLPSNRSRYSDQLREVRDWLQSPSPQTPAIAPIPMGHPQAPAITPFSMG